MGAALTGPLRVVVAIDSFKGSSGSAAAGEAVRAGVLDSAPSASVRVVPIADGGEGTLAAIASMVPTSWVEVSTVDALGDPLRAAYLVLEADRVAVVEAAQTVGLERLDEVDASVPPLATSTGLGYQLKHALSEMDGPVLVGLGGSVTTDGGTGMLRALGARHRQPGRVAGQPSVELSIARHPHPAGPVAGRRPLRRDKPAPRAERCSAGVRSTNGRYPLSDGAPGAPDAAVGGRPRRHGPRPR
jgi:hypothetical protein